MDTFSPLSASYLTNVSNVPLEGDEQLAQKLLRTAGVPFEVQVRNVGKELVGKDGMGKDGLGVILFGKPVPLELPKEVRAGDTLTLKAVSTDTGVALKILEVEHPEVVDDPLQQALSQVLESLDIGEVELQLLKSALRLTPLALPEPRAASSHEAQPQLEQLLRQIIPLADSLPSQVADVAQKLRLASPQETLKLLQSIPSLPVQQPKAPDGVRELLQLVQLFSTSDPKSVPTEGFPSFVKDQLTALAPREPELRNLVTAIRESSDLQILSKLTQVIEPLLTTQLQKDVQLQDIVKTLRSGIEASLKSPEPLTELRNVLLQGQAKLTPVFSAERYSQLPKEVQQSLRELGAALAEGLALLEPTVIDAVTPPTDPAAFEVPKAELAKLSETLSQIGKEPSSPRIELDLKLLRLLDSQDNKLQLQPQTVLRLLAPAASGTQREEFLQLLGSLEQSLNLEQTAGREEFSKFIESIRKTVSQDFKNNQELANALEPIRVRLRAEFPEHFSKTPPIINTDSNKQPLDPVLRTAVKTVDQLLEAFEQIALKQNSRQETISDLIFEIKNPVLPESGTSSERSAGANRKLAQTLVPLLERFQRELPKPVPQNLSSGGSAASEGLARAAAKSLDELLASVEQFLNVDKGSGREKFSELLVQVKQTLSQDFGSNRKMAEALSPVLARLQQEFPRELSQNPTSSNTEVPDRLLRTAVKTMDLQLRSIIQTLAPEEASAPTQTSPMPALVSESVTRLLQSLEQIDQVLEKASNIEKRVIAVVQNLQSNLLDIDEVAPKPEKYFSSLLQAVSTLKEVLTPPNGAQGPAPLELLSPPYQRAVIALDLHIRSLLVNDGPTAPLTTLSPELVKGLQSSSKELAALIEGFQKQARQSFAAFELQIPMLAERKLNASSLFDRGVPRELNSLFEKSTLKSSANGVKTKSDSVSSERNVQNRAQESIRTLETSSENPVLEVSLPQTATAARAPSNTKPAVRAQASTNPVQLSSQNETSDARSRLSLNQTPTELPPELIRALDSLKKGVGNGETLRFAESLKPAAASDPLEPSRNVARPHETAAAAIQLFKNILANGKEKFALGDEKTFTLLRDAVRDLEGRKQFRNETEVQAYVRSTAENVQQLLSASPKSPQLESLQVYREALQGLENIVRGQEVLQQVTPLFQALGEPTFLLFPHIIQGMLSKIELTYYPGVMRNEDEVQRQKERLGSGDGEDVEGTDENAKGKKNGKKKSFERVRFRLSLPALGDIEVDFAHTLQEMILTFTSQEPDSIEFLKSELPRLEESLGELGYETLALKAIEGRPESVRPDWVTAVVEANKRTL